MEQSGKVKVILPKQTISDKLTKQVLVIETTNDKYPQVISFEAVNDRTKLLDNLSVGSDVTVHFNLNGREWVNKQGEKQYFNTLAVWKIDVLSASETPQYAPPAEISSKAEEDDLPFS